MKTGQIVCVSASWGSGLLGLTLRDERGHVDIVWADNAPFVRACDSAFPEDRIIQPGHYVKVEALRGKRIAYRTDGLGVLECFAPVESTEVQTN